MLGKASPRIVLALLAAGFLSTPRTCGDAGEKDAAGRLPASELRAAMIREIEADVLSTRQYTGRSALDARVMAALAAVPRHEFVPERYREHAYENRPLPIGHEQTISQPYIVALMTDLLDVGEDAVVLDIGTGSGYQAAVLAEVVRRVYSIEIVPELGEEAAARLRRLGYKNVEVRVGDGFYGWPERAPFDGILIAAATDEIPQPLLDQMKPGARMILPLGKAWGDQDLLVVEKGEDGKIAKRSIIPVRFVPLTGDHESGR